MVYRDPPRVPLYPVQLDFRTIIVLVGDSKAPGRSLSESTGLRPHEASVKINRPIFALASGLKQLVALLVASHAAEFAKPWKSEGSAALAFIQHSPVQKLRECPADFRARSRVETICKSVLWLSWLPHVLVSSPNLEKAKVRPPSPCRPSYSTAPFKICSV